MLLFTILAIAGMVFHKYTGICLIATSLIYAVIKKNIPLGIIVSIIGLLSVRWRFYDTDMVNATISRLTLLNFAILGYFLTRASRTPAQNRRRSRAPIQSTDTTATQMGARVTSRVALAALV